MSYRGKTQGKDCQPEEMWQFLIPLTTKIPAELTETEMCLTEAVRKVFGVKVFICWPLSNILLMQQSSYLCTAGLGIGALSRQLLQRVLWILPVFWASVGWTCNCILSETGGTFLVLFIWKAELICDSCCFLNSAVWLQSQRRIEAFRPFEEMLWLLWLSHRAEFQLAPFPQPVSGKIVALLCSK